MINQIKIQIFILLMIASSFGIGQTDPVSIAANSIDLTGYQTHIQTLASDEFTGRAPSSVGEQKTIKYLRREFQKLGLQPGNGDSFYEEVPLVEVDSRPPETMKIEGTGRGLAFSMGRDFVALTRRMVDEVSVSNSELVFAGYGIVAPEYGWNDYADLNVKGKTVVVLVNDPGFATADTALFNGRAMTYYGRWTYKYEEAARQGAEGILVVHETAPAGYPWSVVESGWTGPQFYMESKDKNMSRCALEGWISHDAAIRLFRQSGLEYESLKKAAAGSEFKPQSLGMSYSIRLGNKISYSTSKNVIALYTGADRGDEYIIYTAHWDHFGIKPEMEGDSIYNGARDNATGTAALLELAEAFTKLKVKPRRSVLFLAVTAEEQGLLGSAYYASHPIYPVSKTVAVMNMDALNIFGRMKDVTVIGLGNSELDDYVYAAAEKQGRYVRSDPEPEKGLFYRSDHFNFAKRGIPSLYIKPGVDHIEKGAEYGRARLQQWTENYYHTPADEYDPAWWDLSGAIEDIRLIFRIGQQLSMEDTFPNWRKGTEFKAKRDADMRQMAD